MPRSQPNKELLTRGQSYRITMNLEMPESPVNQDTGIFMVLLKFYTLHGEVLKTVSRGTMLHYKSFLLQILETLTYYPMFMMGFREQKQFIAVEMFSNFEESPYKPTIGAYIEIQSRKAHIYSTTLQIHARFTGLRYLLFHWPTTMAVIGISTFLYIYGIIGLLSWYKFHTQAQAEQEHEDSQDWIPLNTGFTGVLDGKDLMQDPPENIAASTEPMQDDKPGDGSKNLNLQLRK
jgi:seipin